MDAALLALFVGHLATALEVPLDRKATNHTVGRGNIHFDLMTQISVNQSIIHIFILLFSFHIFFFLSLSIKTNVLVSLLTDI